MRAPAPRLRHISPLMLGTSSFARAIARGDDPAAVLARVVEGSTGSLLAAVDTSNEYSGGVSEELIGEALAAHPASSTFVSTKLDRDPTTGSFSAERMRESLQESLSRLGLDCVPLLSLHDPESLSYQEAFAEDGPVAALLRMREEGMATAIGISGGPAPMLRRYAATGLFDAVVTHNRHTLVDSSADLLIEECHLRGVQVINAAPYGSAPLARWPERATTYAYRPAEPALARAIDDMGRVASAVGVPLAAAALQFSLRDSRVASTVVGVNSLSQLDATLAAARHPIPEFLWEELSALRPEADTWQDPPSRASAWDHFDIDLTAPHLAGGSPA